MAKVFITGSSDGIGLLAAQLLLEQGHQVVLHGRNQKRADYAYRQAPGADAALVGDLTSIKQTIRLAEKVNALGDFDAVIHNAGVSAWEPSRINTEDGLSHVFAANSLSHYILTCLIKRPKRLVYTSSMLHSGADSEFKDLGWKDRRWNGMSAYSDSKFQNTVLAFAVARLWPDIPSNAVEPGWVPTKMGGRGASDDIDQAHRTQVWLATAKDATSTGQYWYHLRHKRADATTREVAVQDRFLQACTEISGVRFPR